MQLTEIPRKSRVLKKVDFGCLRDSYSMNITRGCSLGCVYCYARGYPDAPAKDHVLLYPDLPGKTALELDNPRRRIQVKHVTFNTATDCFQKHPRILEVAYQTMEVLLQRGVSFSFLTKGYIPECFVQLFAKYPHLVRPAVGLVSSRQDYQQMFEPNAAYPHDRLKNISRLIQAGLKVQVRVDPIMPFVTDDQDSADSLMAALAESGAGRVTLSYLHLRPRILEQLQKELPALEFRLLQSCFSAREWIKVGSCTKSLLVPKHLREKGHSRFSAAAERHGLKTLVCGCKNPDMQAGVCNPRPGKKYREKRGYLFEF